MKLTILIFPIILSATIVFGAEDKKGDEVLLETLQSKVQKLTSRKKNAGPATVAGVKGAKTDRTDIYWKGKEKKLEINEGELQKFKVAIEYLSNGEKDQALKHFDAFIHEFPNSPLLAEATQATQQLRTGQKQPLPAALSTPPAVPATSAPAANPAQALPAAGSIPATKDVSAPDKPQSNGSESKTAK